MTDPTDDPEGSPWSGANLAYDSMIALHLARGGVRFGRGRPNTYPFRVAPEPRQRPRPDGLKVLRCPQCERLFKQTTRRQVGCRAAGCAVAAAAARCRGYPRPARCRVCLAEYDRKSRRNLCCDRCKVSGFRSLNYLRKTSPLLARACARCGAEFRVRSRGELGKFCGKTCQWAYAKGRAVSVFPRPCLHCGGTFRPPRGSARYCSCKCAARAQWVARRKATAGGCDHE